VRFFMGVRRVSPASTQNEVARQGAGQFGF
jgi:hypothetical protein